MKLIPFVLTHQKGSSPTELTKYKWLVFLSHAGRGVWKTDESGLVSEAVIRTDYLEPNGIVPLSVSIDKPQQIAWIQVDPKKTNMSEFYSWEEALASSSKPECWRPFYFFKDIRGADWWSGKGIECHAEIQDLGNVQEVFADVLRRFT